MQEQNQIVVAVQQNKHQILLISDAMLKLARKLFFFA